MQEQRGAYRSMVDESLALHCVDEEVSLITVLSSEQGKPATRNEFGRRTHFHDERSQKRKSIRQLGLCKSS